MSRLFWIGHKALILRLRLYATLFSESQPYISLIVAIKCDAGRGGGYMFKLAHIYGMSSKQLLRACTTAQGTQSDASLAAYLSISLMD
ncbi:hypothetical protein PAXRUDRAFT_593322 [Paxillus rubicundulus Ve08.2h10]|uniref:Uncharacterized protein n=1 Tax=Paxillus rubicundulus Ve08.2h10 TaxID=930991 RepID=A0A0D0E440_9AGAM|nr:hypothetical protein PAXRUDRAFT_593322 [Paxillus rubicundulus Ve08.2h10]